MKPGLHLQNEQRADAVCFALVAAVSSVLACSWSSDGDLGFHLATGREVLRTGHIPVRNLLSYAQPDQTWGLHQWLPAVLFELMFRASGIGGVIGLKMLVVGAIWASVYMTARRLGASPFSSALSCLLAAAASAFRFECRPYIFTHASLALIGLALATYQRDASTRDRQVRRLPRALVSAALLAAVACQLHAGAIDGFILLGLAALACLLEPLRARILGTSALQPCGRLPAAYLLLTAAAGAGLGAAALAVYHPLGPAILLFPLQMGTDSYLGEHLIEFRRAYALPFETLAAFWLLLGLWSLVQLASHRALHAATLLLPLGFALLSLRFARVVFAFAIVAAPALALGLEQLARALARRRAASSQRLRGLALAAVALATPLYAFQTRTFGFGFEPQVWPLAHFAFVRAHGLAGRAFVSDAWAGPFLGMFYPERQVFFDNRLEAYSPGFVRDVYQRIRYARVGWDALLDRYGVELLLLRYTTPGEGRLQGGAPNLRQRLAADPRFTLVRFDDKGELFVRTHGPNAELARNLGLPGIDPDRRTLLGPPSVCAPRLFEALRRGERSATLFGLSALAFHDLGQVQLARELTQRARDAFPEDPWIAQLQQRIAQAP
jgi:hypothetical protein